MQGAREHDQHTLVHHAYMTGIIVRGCRWYPMGRTACLPVCGGLMPRRHGGTEPGPLFVPIPDQQDLICGLGQAVSAQSALPLDPVRTAS